MRFIKTTLNDAFVIEQTLVEDERGFLSRVFCAEEFEKAALISQFVQMNHSRTVNKGTIRGLHYQIRPYSEAKLVKCIRGAVFDVIVDLRKNSPTFLKWYGEILTDKNYKMMYVPKGFAHGIQTLEPDTEIIYLSSAMYSESYERGIKYNDPLVNIIWPIAEITVSQKDENILFLHTNFEGIEI